MSNKSKVKIEDMRVNITYSDKAIDKNNFYGILVNVIKRLEQEEAEEAKEVKVGENKGDGNSISN